jgi:hypothetical protein
VVIYISEIGDINIVNNKENKPEEKIKESSPQRITMILILEKFLHNIPVKLM